MLSESLLSIKGIGPKRAADFAAMGLFSLRDLLFAAPKRFLDFSTPRLLSDVQDGDVAIFKIVSIGKPFRKHISKNLSLMSVPIDDGSAKARAIWFNQSYLYERICKDKHEYICGRIDTSHGLRIYEPRLLSCCPGITPVYSTRGIISQKIMRKAILAALDMAQETGAVCDCIPDDLKTKYGLMELSKALELLHFPDTMQSTLAAQKRIVFENAAVFAVTLQMLRSIRNQDNGVSFNTAGLMEEFLALIPYTPTDAQMRVMIEVADDMRKATAMNRLIQGDVGSGKTLIALFAMYVAVKNNMQAVIMSPTEILAEQNYQRLKQIFGSSAVLITGSSTLKHTEAVLEAIRSGEARVVSGTHALIENKVQFDSLGLVITDEQHRFGVSQRAFLEKKSNKPDVLIMSATPIPRTLSLVMFGDLDVSVVDQMPHGRMPTETHFVPQHKRSAMYRYIDEQVRDTKLQAYVVCPMIEDSEGMENTQSAEAMYDELSSKIAARCALLHGRLVAAKKDEIMNRFRRGEIDILIATTIVEIGIDVPNASIMVIESADRFGLSQLHQLRGRVGRGERRGSCFLLSKSKNIAALDRIATIVSTSDGFRIAEADLKMRGPGDILGLRQHGDSLDASFYSLEKDMLIEVQSFACELMRTAARNHPVIIAAAERCKKIIESVASN